MALPLAFLWEGIQAVLSPVTDIVKGWQARKTQRLESDLKIAEAQTNAKIRILETGQQADIAWENLSIQNSGWKDEWFTIVLSIPAVMCFVPGWDGYVFKGFESLKNCPEWYQWGLMIAIASSFGYRKFADFMALKKGDKTTGE